jgi:hypothetical protein
MVASPMVTAGGGAVVVAILVLGILVRRRRRRATEREHETYLDDLVRGPVTPPTPSASAIEAILVRDDELFAEPPPALPRRVEASEPATVAAPAPSTVSPPLAPEPAPAPVAPAPVFDMPVCKADQLAVHVAELAAQTAALTDAVIDLVARRAAAPAPQPEPEPVIAPEPEPEPEPEVPAPLAFRPLGAPLPDAHEYEELPRRVRDEATVAPIPSEPEPAPTPEPEPHLTPVLDDEQADARVRELMREPPRMRTYDEAFDWPSENELRAYSGRQYSRTDGV